MRFISARQVVLLYDSTSMFLFYAGQVYHRPALNGFHYVPIHEGENKYPAWALIDVDFQNNGPPLSSTTEVWPIQASSPNPVQWDSWSKQLDAAMWGLPLWSFQELVFGYVVRPFPPCAVHPPSRLILVFYSFHLQNRYTAFRSMLKRALSGEPRSSTDDPALEIALEAALKILNQENKDRRNDAVVETDHDEGEDKDMLDEVDNATHQHEDMLVKLRLDNAIKVLVRDATDEYGFAPPCRLQGHPGTCGDKNPRRLQARVSEGAGAG